jgi:hypothetical protein
MFQGAIYNLGCILQMCSTDGPGDGHSKVNIYNTHCTKCAFSIQMLKIIGVHLKNLLSF